MSAQSSDKIYDLAIIGAGPAGSLLAYKLRSRGLKILLLDRLAAPKRKVCGEYLCPLGVNLLKSEGLYDRILGHFPKLNGMIIHSAKGTVVDTNFPEHFGISVDREEFDKNLLNLAAETGVDLRTGVDVLSFSPHADFWRLETSSGPFLTRMMVGADGRNSIVSKTLGNDLEIKKRRVALHIFAYNVKTKNNRKGEMHLFPSGAYIGINPIDDSEINFSLVLDADELKKLGGPLKAMNHYIGQSNELLERFGLLDSTAKIGAAYPIQHRTKSLVPRRHITLVGDAAGFVDPLTGEGMYYALLSASLLADCLLADLQSNLNFTQGALDRYSKAYKGRLREKVLLNRGFQWLIQRPRLIEMVANFLLVKKLRADIFIGIIGNIYSPFSGFLKLLTA